MVTSFNSLKYKDYLLLKPINNKLKFYIMLSTESLKKGAMTLVIVMVALAVHQKFVAPMLVKMPVVAK